MKKTKGFTLTELIAAIVILGILTAIAIVSISKYTSYAKDRKMNHIVDSLKLSAQSKFYLEKEQGIYSVKELNDNNDIESPYGGMVGGFLIVDKDGNFKTCIDTGSKEKNYIDVINGTIICSNKLGVSNSSFNSNLLEKDNNPYKYISYNPTDDFSNLDTEDRKYLDSYVIIEDNDNYEIRQIDTKFIVGAPVYYTIHKKNGDLYEFSPIIVANDGKKLYLNDMSLLSTSYVKRLEEGDSDVKRYQMEKKHVLLNSYNVKNEGDGNDIITFESDLLEWMSIDDNAKKCWAIKGDDKVNLYYLVKTPGYDKKYSLYPKGKYNDKYSCKKSVAAYIIEVDNYAEKSFIKPAATIVE